MEHCGERLSLGVCFFISSPLWCLRGVVHTGSSASQLAPQALVQDQPSPALHTHSQPVIESDLGSAMGVTHLCVCRWVDTQQWQYRELNNNLPRQQELSTHSLPGYHFIDSISHQMCLKRHFNGQTLKLAYLSSPYKVNQDLSYDQFGIMDVW